MAMSRGKKIFLWVAGVLVVLSVVFVLGIALLLASFGDNEPDIRDNSVLVLKIEGALPDYVPEDPFARFIGRDDRSLMNLLTQIRKAKNDRRIGALLLEIDITMLGWGKADEIRDAIADFRASGKPAYAYLEYGTNKEYYLATACDRIYVAPIGDLFIVGLAADVMSLGGALDKLGVKPDFYQIGKYKTAPEQYTRREMSEASREVINAILDEFFNRFVSTIATARRKSVEDVRALIDNAPLGAAEAKQANLIDDAKYRDEVEEELKQRLGYKESDKLSTVKESDYRRVSLESVGLGEGERIALIFASGAIGGGSSNDGNGPFGSQSTGSDTIVKALKDARDDKNIKAIVLRVDSPGGTSYASDVIWHAVEKAKEKKPVVVSMSDVAASGGYYIAATANKIIAEPSTITGSIGVYAGKPVLKNFYDWIGVNNEYVLRGKQAGMFRETEPFNADERAKFEGMLKSFYYDDFLPKVARGRNRDVEYVDSIAQGRVWTGTQAKERGLIDELGGLDKAVEVAKQLANLPADKGVRRVVFPAPRTFLQQWFGGDDEDRASVRAKAEQQQRAALESALPADMRRALRYVSVLENTKRGETMAMLPFDLQIK